MLLVITNVILRCSCNAQIKQLENELLANYSTNIAPKWSAKSRIIVNASLHLMYIVDFNEREETLTSSTWLTFKWNDPFLAWEGKEKYENVSVLYLRQNQVWKPDFVLLNTVENVKLLGHADLSVIVDRNGNVIWEPGQRFKSICEVNIRLYPFDSQACTFWLGSWTYYNDIDGNLTHSEMGLNAYTQNGMWEIVGSEGWRGIIDYGYFSQPTLFFTLSLRRRRTYYVLTTCIPIVILSILNCLVHVLPADSGEKMSFCMTILLSYMVFISFLNDSLPSTSKTVSLLVVYLVSVIALSSLSVINSVAVLRLWNKSDAEGDHNGIAGLPCAACKTYTYVANSESGQDDDVSNNLMKDNLANVANSNKYQKIAKCLDNVLFVVMIVLTITVSMVICMLMVFD